MKRILYRLTWLFFWSSFSSLIPLDISLNVVPPAPDWNLPYLEALVKQISEKKDHHSHLFSTPAAREAEKNAMVQRKCLFFRVAEELKETQKLFFQRGTAHFSACWWK